MSAAAALSDGEGGRRYVHLEALLEKFLQCRAESFLCDTVLLMRDGSALKAHSLVLAAASPVLHAALKADSGTSGVDLGTSRPLGKYKQQSTGGGGGANPKWRPT